MLIELLAAIAFAAQPSWPALPAIVQRIPDGEVYTKCAKAWPLWQHIMFFPILPLGCAERLPAHGACIIWLGETSTNDVLEHELQHCRGYDH